MKGTKVLKGTYCTLEWGKPCDNLIWKRYKRMEKTFTRQLSKHTVTILNIPGVLQFSNVNQNKCSNNYFVLLSTSWKQKRFCCKVYSFTTIIFKTTCNVCLSYCFRLLSRGNLITFIKYYPAKFSSMHVWLLVFLFKCFVFARIQYLRFPVPVSFLETEHPIALLWWI